MDAELAKTPPPPLPRSAGPIAYLTGEYPKVSHTFIQREVAALRALGLRIETCTVRRAPPATVVGDVQKAEERTTYCILETARNPVKLLWAHFNLLRSASNRWWRTAKLAWRTSPPGLKARLWQVFYFLEAGVLAEHLRQMGAIHLHNHFANSSGTVAMLTAEFSGIPYSFTMHGPAEFYEANLWKLGEKVARAQFVVAISYFCRSQLMYFSDRQHWGKIRIVHCGVEPSQYGSVPRTVETARKRIAFVGRLDNVKGAVLLLEAFANLHERHPEAILQVIGDGPARADIEARTRALKLENKVSFLGYCPQEEVAARLEDADLLVLPSFAEGVPVVLMEAMASRIPVISTMIAGIPELVEDGINGRLVSPGDVEGLTAALDGLLIDPALRLALGAKGRQKVETEFNLSHEAEWLADLYIGATTGALPSGLRVKI